MKTVLEQIMREAGALMTGWEAPHVYAKSGHADYVTEADLAVQKLLIEKLSTAFPTASFYAEEKKDNVLGDGLTFIIDPIDGTTNYIRHRRCSAVSVGAVEGRQPIFGGIFDPYNDRFFYAEQGKGAWCNGEQLHVSDVPAANALIGLGTSPYRTELAALTGASVAALLPACGDLRRTGSAAIELCDVASGRSDCCFEWILSPWDYCAGTLLVREAGGTCGNILGGDVTYERPIPYMAANAICFDAIQHILQQVSKAEQGAMPLGPIQG